jgi:hypothetical protein
MSGLAILITCREIHWEAGSIIQPTLDAIIRTPIRMISNCGMLDTYRLRRVLIQRLFTDVDGLTPLDLTSLNHALLPRSQT